jgi:NADH:ubiquinone oxidoreductase subunit F (NADH-binding)/Pyruvate/2-oxoacid:ferredoxin oxidoreductase delta subunit/(2Fe-2S) ferredoxin
LESKFAKLRYEKVEHPVIFVGAGTCGLGAGAKKTMAEIKRWLMVNDTFAEIVEVGCIGLCAEEPMIDVQLPGKSRIAFKKVTSEKVEHILNSMFDGKIPLESVLGQHKSETSENWQNIPFLCDLSFFSSQTRWVLRNCGIINPANIDTYIAYGGYKALSSALTKLTPVEMVQKIIDSGLRGRGGGGFLTGKKWKMAQDQKEEQKYLICNADEGDPGAFMDRAVIEGDPYKLIEGMTLAAYTIGASKAYIYIRAEYPLAIDRLKEAIIQAKDAGLLGHNILDSGFSLEIVIKKGAGAFVCGEETALMHSIEGKRGMPKPRPPFPTQAGLFGKPTVINNVETLANIPEIVAHGEKWFSSIGTERSKGTKVFALSGNINNTGLVEVAMGTPIKDIVYKIGGGIPNGKEFKAVQIGGPSGGCIPASHLHIDIDYESLKTVGAMMGSGGLVVMDEDTCMVDVARFFMDFIQRESCGKCIPCREGTRRMLEILDRITTGRRTTKERATLERFQSIMQLKGLSSVIQDTSLCGLGKSAPNPVLSTLRWFKDEYETHIYEKKCPAKVCKDLLTYSILEENCTGCTICAKKCPTNAIVGSLKHPHYVVMDKCIGCGNCYEVCNFEAVLFE